MIEKINSPVSVKLVCDSKNKKIYPEMIIWNQKEYFIKKIGLRHSYRRGKVLYHVFSVSSETLFFRLVFNTENLYWRLEQIADGYSN